MDVAYKFLIACAIALLTVNCGNSGSSGSSGANKINELDCPSAAIKNENLVRWKTGKISRLVFKNDSSRKKYLKKYANKISAVENNFRIQRPQPMGFSLLGSGGDLNWGMKQVNAEALWNRNILGDGVVVAIIDSGIDTHHKQLSTQLYINPLEIKNGLDDDGNGLIDDINGYDFVGQSGNLTDNSGHGTHVAGVIAAEHSSGKITGLAPHSKLLVYDFFGTNQDGTVFDAIKAIRAAVKSGARVINASWGGPSCSTSLRAEVDALADANVLFVAAAGNESLNIDQTPAYPAAFNSISQITVGAMTYDEYTAGFSNYGNRVDIVAPGVNIVSTYPGNFYENMTGTSMATPFVVGAAALLWSAYPQATAVEIKSALLSSAKAGYYPVKSRGSLDVQAALAILEKQFPLPLP
jgi:subtilisin family serine protease